MLKVDFHFHPNFFLLSKTLTRRKAERIWQTWAEHDFGAVLVSEHNFKDPQITFELLEKYKPLKARTFIFPAIEVLTAEGVDILVFAKDKQDIYHYQELTTPWFLTVNELVDFVKAHQKLFGVVVHPFTLGTTGILQLEKLIVERTVRALGFVEAHNCSLVVVQRVVEFLYLDRIFSGIYRKIKNNRDIPIDFITNDWCQQIIFTGGSDAHHTQEIGGGMFFEVEENLDRDRIFEIITTRSGKFFENINKKWWRLLLVGLNVVGEHLKQYVYSKNHPRRG